MNVYNIVWADDEIDFILNEDHVLDLEEQGFRIVGKAHNGQQLRSLLDCPDRIDAVIVDANFNETNSPVVNERATSGFDCARSLYIDKLNKQVPFFLFTNRSDELLKKNYEFNPIVLEKDFPRRVRWFKKSEGEKDLLEAIKKAVDEKRTPSFIVRNKFREILDAAEEHLNKDSANFLYEFLICDNINSFENLKEPFFQSRLIIEQLYLKLESLSLIPPISNDTNGTTHYLRTGDYGTRQKDKIKIIYKCREELFPKPVSLGLKYIVDILQDAAHKKKGLKLQVDDYYSETKDSLLLRSVVYLLIDIIKQFATIEKKNKDTEINAYKYWEELKD